MSTPPVAERFFDRVFGSTVDRPGLVIFILVALSALSLLGRYQPELITGWFRPAEEETQEESGSPIPGRRQPVVPDVKAVSISNADAVLVVKSQEFFTRKGSAAIRKVVTDLEALPYVRNVFWMDRAPVLNLFGFRESLFPPDRSSDRQFEEARERAINHPLISGQLLAKDGNTLLLMIHFDWLFVTSDEDCTDRLKQTALDAIQGADVDFEFLLTGSVPGYLTFISSQEEHRFRYQAIGYGSILMMAIVLFRGIRAVLIVSIAPAVGVFWTLGILPFFDFQDNPFNDIILPVLLSLVGLTDGVHLMVEIRKRRGKGMSVREAARSGICCVGLACALTSITTAIGFGSLSLAKHEIVREFGLCCVIGVLLTFLSVVLTIPLACSTRLGNNIHLGHDRGLIDRNLNRVSGLVEYVLKRSSLYAKLGIGLTAALALISLQLRPDERRANALPQHSETVLAIQHMDEAFGGLEMSRVNISWGENVDSESAEVLQVVMAVDDLLQSEPLIGNPVSIRNFIDVLPGSGSPEDRMPLLQLLPANLKRAFYEPERRHAEVSFRVQDLGIAKYGEVFTRIETGLEQIHQAHPE
ncbi:MAG: MMPL family transporter, partial [Planctomycetaceae bacterium]|nr:MMPL family transporter [Planctomycetaceae bacterium]